MSNFVRAIFCITEPTEMYTYGLLLNLLEEMNCRYILTKGDTSIDYPVFDATQMVKDADLTNHLGSLMSSPGFIKFNFEWTVNNRSIAVELIQFWKNYRAPKTLSFCVSEELFLDRSEISYYPQKGDAFLEYKSILSTVITCMNPFWGVIDYEADWLCVPTSHEKYTAGWGNYISYQFSNQWSLNDVNELKASVSEMTLVDDKGTLIFIHPLMANQAWTLQHDKVSELFSRYTNSASKD